MDYIPPPSVDASSLRGHIVQLHLQELNQNRLIVQHHIQSPVEELS